MKTNINRRRFLSISALAGTGALLAPGQAVSAVNLTAGENEKIPTRILGKTQLEIPILSMGVMRADNPAVVRAAYNSGITFFDTAHGYQNGKNEEMLGTFFKDKPRNSFIIATKAKGNLQSETFEKDYEEMLETSLRRLQMDHLDLFYAHALGNADEVKDPRLIAMLNKFKKEGKTRFIGFSTHANKPEQIDAAIEAGIYDVILISYNFKLKNLKETEEAIERGAQAGIGFVAMKTMTGGVENAEGKKIINGAACLKWVWQNKNFTTAIPGFTNYDLLDNCLSAAYSPTPDATEKEYLAGLMNQEMLYCVNCEKCVEQCPEHLPIPDMMRAYMYTYGYKQPALSKETLAGLNLPETACTSCSTCRVTCTEGFNVSQKIAAITPLLRVPNDYLV